MHHSDAPKGTAARHGPLPWGPSYCRCARVTTRLRTVDGATGSAAMRAPVKGRAGTAANRRSWYGRATAVGRVCAGGNGTGTGSSAGGDRGAARCTDPAAPAREPPPAHVHLPQLGNEAPSRPQGPPPAPAGGQDPAHLAPPVVRRADSARAPPDSTMRGRRRRYREVGSPVAAPRPLTSLMRERRLDARDRRPSRGGRSRAGRRRR
jgi:hypothetical protein